MFVRWREIGFQDPHQNLGSLLAISFVIQAASPNSRVVLPHVCVLGIKPVLHAGFLERDQLAANVWIPRLKKFMAADSEYRQR